MRKLLILIIILFVAGCSTGEPAPQMDSNTKDVDIPDNQTLNNTPPAPEQHNTPAQQQGPTTAQLAAECTEKMGCFVNENCLLSGAQTSEGTCYNGTFVNQEHQDVCASDDDRFRCESITSDEYSGTLSLEFSGGPIYVDRLAVSTYPATEPMREWPSCYWSIFDQDPEDQERRIIESGDTITVEQGDNCANMQSEDGSIHTALIRYANSKDGDSQIVGFMAGDVTEWLGFRPPLTIGSFSPGYDTQSEQPEYFSEYFPDDFEARYHATVHPPAGTYNQTYTKMKEEYNTPREQQIIEDEDYLLYRKNNTGWREGGPLDGSPNRITEWVSLSGHRIHVEEKIDSQLAYDMRKGDATRPDKYWQEFVAAWKQAAPPMPRTHTN